MISKEQAEAVKKQAWNMFPYPLVNAVGLIKVDDELAVSVNFVNDKPDIDLPESIDGIKIVYRFNCGEIKTL